MNELKNKLFIAIDVIETTILCPLKSQILREIEISDEKEVDKILLESEYRLNFVQSILQQKTVMIANVDQQVTLPLQKQIVPDILPKLTKSKQPQSKETGEKKSTAVKKDVIPKQSAKKKTSKKTVAEDEIIQIAEQLKNTNSREEARNLIPNEYTVEQLKVLAKQLGVSIPSKIHKDDLIEKIVQDIIGYRIDSMAIQDHKWDK